MFVTKEQQLWTAATDGDLPTVELLCSDPTVDVNWTSGERMDSPLHRSCRFGKTPVAVFLLAHPRVDLNLLNNRGCTPFYIACQEHSTDIVRILMAHPGIDVLHPHRQGHTPFSKSCGQGHLDIVELLLADPRTDVNHPTDFLMTPFSFACQEGMTDVVARLLRDPRVDVNLRDKWGESPFFVACWQNVDPVIRLLLADPRIDLDLPNHLGVWPLWVLAHQGHLSLLQLLLSSGREFDTLRETPPTMALSGSKTPAGIARLQVTFELASFESPEDFTRCWRNCPLIADLLDEYHVAPVAVRGRLRRLPHIREPYIARTFALMVFFADGFLKPSVVEPPGLGDQVLRFLRLAAKLPLELQMLLSHRVFNSGGDIILQKDSESGFRWLVCESSE